MRLCFSSHLTRKEQIRMPQGQADNEGAGDEGGRKLGNGKDWRRGLAGRVQTDAAFGKAIWKYLSRIKNPHMLQPSVFAPRCRDRGISLSLHKDTYEDVRGNIACGGESWSRIRAHAGEWRGETWSTHARKQSTAIQSHGLWV